MTSTQKLLGIISCAVLVGLGLPVADPVQAEQSDRGQGGKQQAIETVKNDQSQRGKIIKGEVSKIEGDNWFVKGKDGKETKLHVDQSTRMPEQVDGQKMKGVPIEATVTDQNHVLSISSPDRRNDHQ